MRPTNKGPDFLCIGMGKSGTGWLFDQLQHHPLFWMPPIKEIHYLDKKFPENRKLRSFGNEPEKISKKRENRGKRRLEARDFEFVRELKNAIGDKRDLDFYARMFRFKGNQLSGDITPSYCGLEKRLIKKLNAVFPHLKIILLARDPVARAWSHFSMKHRNGQVPAEDLLDPGRFKSILQSSKVTEFGSPARIAKKWKRVIPHAQFRAFFFDDIVTDPKGERIKILKFLGADPAQGSLDAAHNRKAGKPKLELTDDLKEILVAHFSEELALSAKHFGGPALAWAAKYGIAPKDSDDAADDDAGCTETAA